MRVLLWILCVPAILVTLVDQGNCAAEINNTSALKLTTDSHDASTSDKAIEFATLTNRTKRTKRSVTFNGGTHEHHHSIKNAAVCQSYKFLPPNEAKGHVFRAGYDIYGHELGICQAVVSGELTPGKYREDWGACLVPSGSKEHVLKSAFQVLTMPQAKYFSWERVNNGQVPPHGMAWGRASDGAPKYIARCLTSFNGRKTLVPGKMDHGHMYFAFDWKEHVCGQRSIEVLTCKGA